MQLKLNLDFLSSLILSGELYNTRFIFFIIITQFFDMVSAKDVLFVLFSIFSMFVLN